VLEIGIVPQVPTASALPHTWTLKWVYKELGGATVGKWKKNLILLCVKIVDFSTTLDNIFFLMFKHMLEFGGLGLEELFLKS
jgi:hypothetical protein